MSDVDQWKGNGWTKYQIMVLAQLEQHSHGIEKLKKQNDDILEKLNDRLHLVNIDIAMMKTQQRMTSVMFGFMGSILPVMFDMFVNFKK